MNTRRSHAIAAVTAAALALTSFSAAPALAAPKAVKQAQTANAETSTEFSSQRRRYHRGYRNNAAGAAAFAAIVGGIATYAAAREYRKSREREYQYRSGYYGYGEPYGYYAPRRHYYGW